MDIKLIPRYIPAERSDDTRKKEEMRWSSLDVLFVLEPPPPPPPHPHLFFLVIGTFDLVRKQSISSKICVWCLYVLFSICVETNLVDFEEFFGFMTFVQNK